MIDDNLSQNFSKENRYCRGRCLSEYILIRHIYIGNKTIRIACWSMTSSQERLTQVTLYNTSSSNLSSVFSLKVSQKVDMKKKKKSWITVGHRVQYCYGCYFSSSRYHLHLLKKKKTLLIYTRELVDTSFKDFVLYSCFVWIQFFFEDNFIRLGWPNEISRNPRNRNQIYPSCFLPSKRR